MGYAPYHYGRWAYVSNQWYWVPDSVNTTLLIPRRWLRLFRLLKMRSVAPGSGDPYAPRYTRLGPT